MSKSDNNKGVLSQHTPITTALAIAICGGAFWAGRTAENLRLNIESQGTVMEIKFEEIKEWKDESSKILKTLTKIAEDNKRRLDYIEDEK